MGYTNLAHAKADNDLDFVRKMPEYARVFEDAVLPEAASDR
jgi:hypothetical protein